MGLLDLSQGPAATKQEEPGRPELPQPPKVEPPGRKLDNWLAAYAEYTADNEAPEPFHLWTALSTIAGAAQRKIWLEMLHVTYHTNMYVILAGPPGSHKSTALRIGKNLLKQVPGIHFTTSATSPEKLINSMSKIVNPDGQSLTAYASELSSFLGRDREGMVDFLTDIYDCEPDWDKQTIARDVEKIDKPWLNVIAGVVPEWLGDNLTVNMVQGGYIARNLVVYCELEKFVAFPEETPRHKELRKLLINDLTQIYTLRGQFVLDDEQKEPLAVYQAAFDFSRDFALDKDGQPLPSEMTCKQWYKAYYDAGRFRRGRTNDARTAGYFVRKHAHALKVAMLLNMAERDDLKIRLIDLHRSIALLNDIEPGIRKAFSAVGRNIYATDMERILAQIRESGRMPYAEIVKRNYHAMDSRKLDEILKSLQDMREIKLESGNIYEVVGRVAPGGAGQQVS